MMVMGIDNGGGDDEDDIDMNWLQLLSNVRSIKSSYRRLCSELHRDIGQLRRDIDKLAGQQTNKGHYKFIVSLK